MQFEETKVSFSYNCDNLGHVKQLYPDISFCTLKIMSLYYHIQVKGLPITKHI